MTDPQHLRIERRDDGVAVLTLDNPDQRNAMSDPMTASWVAAVDELADDRDLRAVVVTGAGTAFCSGGDTGWIAGEPDASVDDLRTRMLAFYRAWLSIRRLEVPTIAAVNGPAIGAGLCLALACDLRYAAEGARLGVPFVRLGMHPGMAATHLLPDVVGAAHARDLLLTGRLVRADEALRMGLVSQVHRGHSTHRHPSHHRRAPGRRAPRPRVRGAVGGPRPAGHAGHGRPAGGHPGGTREADAAVHR
jgi:enoyl-CoA hydratase/carnithine racemase